MAIYPCDRHGARYTGSQQTAYPALLDGSVSRREKRRLCQVCFAVTREWCVQHLALYDQPEPLPEGCCICGGDTSVAIFVTLYATREDRVDYFGRCCADCGAGPVAMALFGTQKALEGF